MENWSGNSIDDMFQILEITPAPLPFKTSDKIFQDCDDEGNIIGEPYSMDDQIKLLKDISGVSEDLLGKYEAPV